MTNGIATVELKRMRGKLTVIGNGRTPRGRKYIKHAIPIKATRTSDKLFKSQMEAAVIAMFEESPTEGP